MVRISINLWENYLKNPRESLFMDTLYGFHSSSSSNLMLSEKPAIETTELGGKKKYNQ